MKPHPRAVAQPAAFWNAPYAEDAAPSGDPAAYLYRPEWFAQITPSAPAGSHACALAHAHPAVAFELLRRNYAAMAETIEPALDHSGEYTYRLLTWSHSRRVPLRRSDPYYLEALAHEGQWGLRFAKLFHQRCDRKFGSRINRWAADNRESRGAAAALFLTRHPREPIEPYNELLRTDLPHAYWAMPYLHGRGFRLGPSDTTDPKWAYHLALSHLSRDNGDYLPILRRDPVWLVGFLLARDGKIEPKLARETAAQLKAEHPNHPLLPRALSVLSGPPLPAIPPVLASGQQAEIAALERLRRQKNREVYRPSEEQMNSLEFKRIVGPPQYTEQGYARGTVMDVADGEFAEIKSGTSPLEPTYQLRLQAYRASVENRPLRIYTNRPPTPQFTEKITPLGVAIEPLPE